MTKLTFSHISAILILCALNVVTYSMLPSDYCRFDESLKEKLRQVQCDSDWDDCATKIRQIAQNSQAGAWGVVVVGNKDDIMNEKIERNISSINPEPSRCRLLINDTVLIELFRTGYRTKDIKNDQVILVFAL